MTISSLAPQSPTHDSPRETAVREPRAATPHILVVDDEPVVRAYIGRILEAQGYAVKHAGTAADAFELLLTEPAAAIVCDVRMPDRDGLWLAERIHVHWPRIPIVMATAVDDLATIQKSRDLGAVDYIAKPVDAGQLLEAMRRVVAGSVESSAAAAPVRDETSGTDEKIDAEYALETPVRCPACGERVTTLKAVRLIRARVNFTSTLPRRGRVVACPHCLAIVPAELTNF